MTNRFPVPATNLASVAAMHYCVVNKADIPKYGDPGVTVLPLTR